MKLRTWLWLITLPAAAACAHAAPAAKSETPAAPPVAEAQPQPAPAAAAPGVTPATTCAADDQCANDELCEQSRCVAISPELTACRVQAAHFDFDRSDLREADRLTLRRSARCLVAMPSEKALIDGNCDERGTAQYNVALGFRRAHAVAKYLSDLGVPASQLQEVSYGKELPICSEHGESCWALNRRTDVAPGAQPKEVAALMRRDQRKQASARAKGDAVAKDGR